MLPPRQLMLRSPPSPFSFFFDDVKDESEDIWSDLLDEMKVEEKKPSLLPKGFRMSANPWVIQEHVVRGGGGGGRINGKGGARRRRLRQRQRPKNENML